MKLLIGSHNPAKIKYYTEYLKDTVEIITLADLNINKDPEETGKTIEENALLKAKHFYKLTGLATLSDDGAFSIDALKGEPGIKARRWIGRRMTDKEMVEETMKRMQGKKNRTARLETAVNIYGPQGTKIFIGASSGLIPLKAYPTIEPGFPARSTFILPQFNKFYIELTEAEKATVDHRKQLIPDIKKYLKTIC